MPKSESLKAYSCVGPRRDWLGQLRDWSRVVWGRLQISSVRCGQREVLFMLKRVWAMVKPSATLALISPWEAAPTARLQDSRQRSQAD